MAKEVKARVLADAVIAGVPVKCNSVVSLDAAEVKLLEAQGVVDPTPAAVAFAESLSVA